MAIAWLVEVRSGTEEDYKHYDPDGIVWNTVLASVILDILLAGSELVHKVRLHFVNKRNRELQKMQQEGNEDVAGQELRPINRP